MDTTPSTFTVTGITHRVRGANIDWLLTGHDEDGKRFVASLTSGLMGAKYWFAETIHSRILDLVKTTGAAVEYPITSTYDEDRDEWFTRAGNYGIHSRDLHFTPVEA